MFLAFCRFGVLASENFVDVVNPCHLHLQLSDIYKLFAQAFHEALKGIRNERENLPPRFTGSLQFRKIRFPCLVVMVTQQLTGGGWYARGKQYLYLSQSPTSSCAIAATVNPSV